MVHLSLVSVRFAIVSVRFAIVSVRFAIVPLIVEILLLLHVARVFGVVGAEILDFFHFE